MAKKQAARKKILILVKRRPQKPKTLHSIFTKSSTKKRNA